MLDRCLGWGGGLKGGRSQRGDSSTSTFGISSTFQQLTSGKNGSGRAE